MPKKQPTAAKRARAAARTGAKYTAALREATGPHLPPHLELFDDQALPEGERLVVDCLRALAAEGEPLPVRLAEPDPEVVEAQMRAEEKGIRPQWRRWASVEAAVDGYVLRETQYGPNRSGYTKTNRGPRVPVPVRAADGTVTVVAMPEWAWLHEAVGEPYEVVRGMTPFLFPVMPVQPERLRGDPHNIRIEIQQDQLVLLQPRLEPHMTPSRRGPPPAWEMPESARPAERPYGSRLLPRQPMALIKRNHPLVATSTAEPEREPTSGGVML